MIYHGFPQFAIILRVPFDPRGQKAEVDIGKVRNARPPNSFLLQISPQLAKCNFM
jgi:uncharacterized protein YcgL (UPF0745 family)